MDPTGTPRLQFPRHTGRTDLICRVRASTDLAGWTTIASSTAGAPLVATGALSASEAGAGEVKTVTVEDSIPLGSIPRRFLRLEITR